MIERTFEHSFAAIIFMAFFVIAIIYNIGYFNAIGDSITYFFYIPTGFTDLVKTGLYASVLVLLFLVLFKSVMINPAFKGIFPTAKLILWTSASVLICNLCYFSISINSYGKLLSLASEALLYVFAITCFFSITYHLCRNQSRQILFFIFLLSLIPTALFVGWLDAKLDVMNFSDEAKSKILLQNDKVITAKLLRSFDRGMLVMIDSSSNINFITWDQIKEVKFKRVNSF